MHTFTSMYNSLVYPEDSPMLTQASMHAFTHVHINRQNTYTDRQRQTNCQSDRHLDIQTDNLCVDTCEKIRIFITDDLK